MIVIDSDKTAWFDCDDTLVSWDSFPGEEGTVLFKTPAQSYYLKAKQGNIDQLKLHFSRGHRIVVWSAGGYEWAKCVVDTLGLQDYVSLVVSKPQWIYDDLPLAEVFPEHLRRFRAN